MPPDTIVVFIDAERVEVPPGSTALDAVRRWNPDTAEQVASGARQLSDARGLPLGADSAVYGGAIYRVIGGRRGTAGAPPAGDA
jgi:hypothetical protein